MAGSTGSAIANLCIYPLDLIITRLQVQRQLRASHDTPEEGEYSGVLDAASQIYNNEGGITAFYSGVIPDTGKSIADSFLFFLFYNFLREKRLQKHGSSTTTLPVLDELGVGMLAGACSKFFTTPISNIVTRKQTAAMRAARSGIHSTDQTVSDIVAQIRSDKGLQGFWSGYSASLVLTLNPSLTFFLYETFKRTLLPRSRRDDPGARVTFLMAAVSKAIASTITYPFSLAKARAQAGSKPPVNPESIDDIRAEAKAAGTEKRTAKAEKTGKDIKRTAARSTVFSTILKIYREEGPSALYEGVWGEIFKGFFSHGITMLVKEAVHKVIIQMYFAILKLLNKAPTSAEVVDQAKDAAGQVGDAVSGTYDKVAETAGDVAQSVNNKVASAYDDTKKGLGEAYERVQAIGSNSTELAKSGSDQASDAVESAVQTANKTVAEGIDGAKKGLDIPYNGAQSIGSNATDAVKTGGEKALDVASQVREKMGDALVDTGKSIKPENKN